jgi:PAS domain S-box-containing protein
MHNALNDAEHSVLRTIAELKDRLAESEDVLRAIRYGDVDAITVPTSAGMQVYSLESAETRYREMVEAINEGVVNVTPAGVVTYSNRRFADMAGTDLSRVIGSRLQMYFAGHDSARLGAALLDFGATRFRAQMLDTQNGTVAVNVSLHRRSSDENQDIICVVVTDLTDIEAAQTAYAEAHLALQQQLAELQKSEQRYHSLLDTMNEGLIETDAIPSLTYVNPRFAEMLGYSVEDLLDRPMIRFLINEPEERLHERVAARMAGHAETYELTWRHRDGHEVSTLVSARPHFRPDGCYIGATVNVTDITEKKRADTFRAQAEATLRAASSYARNLLEASLDPLVTINRDGKITDVNKATESATGLPRDQLVGRDFSDFFTDPDLAQAAYRIAFAEGSVTEYPLSIRNTSGSVMEVLYNASTYCDETGKVVGVFAAARDVTARKQAETELADYRRHLEDLVAGRTAELASANAALNAANNELEAFAYSVSHDLRAPLRAVDGFSHALQEDYADALDAEAKRLIQIIRDGVMKMAQLIDDILEFSRAARRDLASTDIDMTGLAQDALNDLAQAMKGRSVTVNVASLPRANGDREMMKRVWMNLLDNAIKFTAQKANARIDVGSYRQGGNIVYFVKDNGAGFDMSYVDKLFGVFQRLHSPEEFPGTGAGLAIVKRIVSRHGGRVWAEGKVGEGATLYFALPSREPDHV